MSRSPSPDVAAWWEQHLADLVSHEREQQRFGGLRAALLALLTTVLALGGPLAAIRLGGWATLGFLPAAILALAFAFALAAAAIFWLALAPMEGRGWSPHSASAWLLRRATAGKLVEPLAGLLPARDGAWRENLRQARRLHPELSEKVRAAARRDELELPQAHRSPEARAALAAFLRDALGADLDWWLDPGEGEVQQHLAAARVRQVFWFWSQRQAAQAFADLVRLGLRLAGVAALLALAALLTHALSWWLLLVVPLVAGLAAFGWALKQAQP